MAIERKNRKRAGPIVQILPVRRKISATGFMEGMKVIPKTAKPKIKRKKMARRTLSNLFTLV